MSNNINLIGKYVVMFVILTGLGILYDKYKLHNKTIDNKNDYKLIQQYLLNEEELPLGSNKKPILWIHIDREKNARYWDSFYSWRQFLLKPTLYQFTCQKYYQLL